MIGGRRGPVKVPCSAQSGGIEEPDGSAFPARCLFLLDAKDLQVSVEADGDPVGLRLGPRHLNQFIPFHFHLERKGGCMLTWLISPWAW